MLYDAYGRRLNYLRLSVTDRCNLRCRYCMPEEGVQLLSHTDILQYDEILRILRVMVSLGVDRVRLTGGEPLVRRDIVRLASGIKEIPGIRFLGLTTNGVLLGPMAQALYQAGVDGLNISLDTVDPKRFIDVTRRDNLTQVWEGLQQALAVGFSRVKLNCVLAPGSIPADWLQVVALAKDLPVDVRLIEWMPVADGIDAGGINADEALQIIEEHFGLLSPVQTQRDAGPARYWQISGFSGRLCIISAMTHNFCGDCNRLRMTATGNLKLCLFYDTGIPLKALIRGGASDEALAQAIREAVQSKPKQHWGIKKRREDGVDGPLIERTCGMYDLGG